MQIQKLVLAAASALTMAGVGALADDAGDPKKGEKTFKKCKACHQVGDEAKNKTGPLLNGVMGRQAGIGADFSYGADLVAAGEAGLVWTEENLDAWLADPKQFLKDNLDDGGAKSKMVLKLKKEKDRKNVIAYIAQFTEAVEETTEETTEEN